MTVPNRSLQGRVILITGGSRGIGLALSQQLAKEGANVWLLARQKEGLEKAVATLSTTNGSQHGYVSADVTDPGQVRAAVEEVTRRAGLPEILINCAGGAHPAYIQETPLEVFHQMMDLNYFGTVNMVQTLLPAMLARCSGYIVNFSSGAGFLAPFGYSAYAPSKFAVRAYSDLLRLELKPLGLQVSVVFPPDTDTPGMENENKTKPFETLEAFSSKLVSAEQVARQVLRGMKRRQYIILPGFEISLYYRLVFLLGNAIYPVFDFLLAQARRKKGNH